MAQKVLRFFGAYSTTGKCACRINHLSPYGQIFLGSELKSISRPDHGYNPLVDIARLFRVFATAFYMCATTYVGGFCATISRIKRDGILLVHMRGLSPM